MKIGVLGDVHANEEALDAVLADMATHNPERYICVGDVVGYGASIHECIGKIRDLEPIMVAGNHDWAAVNKINSEYFNFYAKEAILWTGEQLTSDERNWLTSLPMVIEEEGFTVAHSTIFKPELFSYVQTSYDAHLSFETLNTPVGFVGHSHIPVTFLCQDYISFTLDSTIQLQQEEKALVNVGSVGQPRDENNKAAYGIYDTDKAVVELFRVEYDIAKAAKKIKDAGLPSILADRLYIGQ